MIEPDGSQPGNFHSYNSPYVPADGYGAFLDQDPNETPVFYSVKVPQDTTIQFHGENIEWNFQNWIGEDVVIENPNQTQTNVVFRDNNPNVNSTITAIYKGHLASNTIEATSHNNGRRIVQDYAGNWHLVYEDDDKIFYTYSSNNGQDWIPEVQLSNTSSYARKTPAIDSQRENPVESGINYTAVIWDAEYNYGAEILHKPVLKFKTDGAWSQEIEWRDVDLNTEENCLPVITGTLFRKKWGDHEVRFYVLCETTEGLALLQLDNEEDYYYLKEVWNPFTGTTENSRHATITSSAELDGDNYLYLSWEDNGRIYYSYFNIQNSVHPEEPIEVSPPGGLGSYYNPSICYDEDGLVNVAWQWFDGETGWKFQHQQLTEEGDPVGPVYQVSLYGHNITEPSLGSFVNGGNGSVVASVDIGTEVRFLNFTDEWDWLDYEFSGNHPVVNDRGNEIMSVWTAETSAPYLIKDQLLLSSGEMTMRENLLEKRYRKEIFDLSELSSLNLRGFASLSYGDIQVQNSTGIQNWSFGNLKDSLALRKFMQTAPLTITNDMNLLIFPYKVIVKGLELPNKPTSLPLFRVCLLDKVTGSTLAVLKNLDIKSISGPNFRLNDTLEVDLTPFHGKEVILQMQSIHNIVMNNGSLPWQITIQEFYPEIQPERLALHPENLKNKTPDLPLKFNLNQNYPNPFNPTTQISFALPQAQFVMLEIYDISGRKVRTLVNEFKEAGIYSITWDSKNDAGEQVSSGVYIYQIKAGSFIANHKMMLLR